MKLFPDDEIAQFFFALFLGAALLVLAIGFACWLTGFSFK